MWERNATTLFIGFDITFKFLLNVFWSRDQKIKAGLATASDELGDILSVAIANEANES